jgi:hypothetical protein
MNPAGNPEPSGPDLVKRFRALLPERLRYEFDENADGYDFEPDGVSQCGALMSLTSPFVQAVAAREIQSVRAIIDLVDELLAYPQGRDETGSLRNSVLSCFLEDVLPLPADVRPLVALGTNIRDHAEKHSPSWLGAIT